MGIFDDLEQVYRPILAVSVCVVCGGDVAHHGKTVHLPVGSPVRGIDPSRLVNPCHGHAVRVDEVAS